MALASATLVSGATISVTGGTTVTFAPSGTEVPEGIELVNVTEADFRLRSKATCRSKMPSYNPGTATYTMGKRFVSLTIPKLLADGSTIFPTARLEITDHPEMTNADRLEMRKQISQIPIDSDWTQFFETGSKA